MCLVSQFLMFSARFACSNGQLQSIISLSAYSRWFYLFFGQLESSVKTLTFRVSAYRWRNTVLKFSFSSAWHKLQVQCDEVWYFEFFYWSGIQVLQIDCQWIKNYWKHQFIRPQTFRQSNSHTVQTKQVNSLGL